MTRKKSRNHLFIEDYRISMYVVHEVWGEHKDCKTFNQNTWFAKMLQNEEFVEWYLEFLKDRGCKFCFFRHLCKKWNRIPFLRSRFGKYGSKYCESLFENNRKALVRAYKKWKKTKREEEK